MDHKLCVSCMLLQICGVAILGTCKLLLLLVGDTRDWIVPSHNHRSPLAGLYILTFIFPTFYLVR
jgi:hypothetical protein